MKIEWWEYLAVLAGLAVVSLVLHVLVKSAAPRGSRGRRFGAQTMFLGDDERTSTSKLQAMLWTYAVLWALISLLVGLGVDGFSEALTGAMDNPGESDKLREEYLVLLGGPYAAAIIAKGITTDRITKDPKVKPPKPVGKSTLKGRLVEVIANDEGDVDLGDLQYFAFTLVTLAYFAMAFVDKPLAGLPAIPGTLLLLAGLSQATYVGKKALKEKSPADAETPEEPPAATEDPPAQDRP